MVTMAELEQVWHRRDAIGLTLDHVQGLKIVHLEDGSSFAARLGGDGG